ncbi:MAG TPA: nucleoside phosphorylase [Thermoflexales bacterium]|nr:nucleoside phosphorylase [Thermoflexales bacterium]
MSISSIPLLDFDPGVPAHIEPSVLIQRIDMAEACVVCFFADVIAKIAQEHNARVLCDLKSEIGANPLYEMEMDGRRVAFFHPGVGAPLAAAFLEEAIALGGRRFVACGGAGVLQKDIAMGHLIVPTSAVRDEGTSHHYLPASREVAPTEAALNAIRQTLQKDGAPFIEGKTWTTDAIYRETPKKIAMRRDEGCVTVEMEASAFFAVARFRGVEFGQILYGGDDLSSDTWDSRHWTRNTSVREKLFWLAAEAALKG